MASSRVREGILPYWWDLVKRSVDAWLEDYAPQHEQRANRDASSGSDSRGGARLNVNVNRFCHAASKAGRLAQLSQVMGDVLPLPRC
jgi:hypothetical protein